MPTIALHSVLRSNGGSKPPSSGYRPAQPLPTEAFAKKLYAAEPISMSGASHCPRRDAEGGVMPPMPRALALPERKLRSVANAGTPVVLTESPGTSRAAAAEGAPPACCIALTKKSSPCSKRSACFHTSAAESADRARPRIIDWWRPPARGKSSSTSSDVQPSLANFLVLGSVSWRCMSSDRTASKNVCTRLGRGGMAPRHAPPWLERLWPLALPGEFGLRGVNVLSPAAAAHRGASGARSLLSLACELLLALAPRAR